MQILTTLFVILFWGPSSVNLADTTGVSNVNQSKFENCACCSTGAYAWVWDGSPSNARLTSAGKKKLDKLKQQLKDSAKIKQQMYASDFEYMCTKILKDNPNRCPQGNPYGAPKAWKEYSQVCNKPNYCPNIPGL